MPKRHAKFRLWNCLSYPQDSETAELHKAIIMNKAVTVLHCDRFCIIIANCPSPHSDRHSALSQSLFVLQSSVCLYCFAFELSHSLFVGERACPSRCTKPFHSHRHLKRTSIPRFTPHSPKRTQKSAIRVYSGFFIFNSQHSSKWCSAVKQ